MKKAKTKKQKAQKYIIKRKLGFENLRLFTRK